MVLLCLIAGPVIAQPPPALPRAVADSNDDVTSAETTDEPNVRRIYVPTAELDALLKGDRSGVLLPKAEFNRLFNAARSVDEKALKHASGISVTAADAQGRIVDDQLRLSIDVRLRQFENGWHLVRLPIAGLSLRSASLDENPVALARDGNDRNTLMAFSDTAGEHVLSLELAVALKSVGSDWMAEFQTLGVPSGTLTLDLEEGKSLLIDGLKYERTSKAEADSPYRVPFGGRSQLSLRITDRDLRNAADALVFANTAYGLQVAPGEVTWTTQTSVQAYGQSLSQLTFSVPTDLEVAAIESTGLEEWTLSETDRGRRTLITLNYRQPFDGERTVTIRGVLAPEEGEWTVPNLQLQNADSHAGTIVVKHGPDVRLQADYGDEVRPVAQSSESQSLQFRTMDPEFDLEFRTLGKPQSVQIAMTTLLNISDDGLDLQTVMDVDAYFAPLFDVRITLPVEFEVTAARVGDAAVQWIIVAGAAGVSEVRIPLEQPLKPSQTRRITLSAHADPEDWPVERDPILLPFPEVGLPQADIVEARYGIMADADLEVRTVDLTGLDPARNSELTGLKQAATALGQVLRLGFNDQDTSFSGQLEITRKPTRLSVSTLSLSRLDPQTVRTDLRAFVTVEGGGTQGLLIQLPESVGTDLRFVISPILKIAVNLPVGNSIVDGLPVPTVDRTVTGPTIVEQTVTAPVDGQRTWALRFDRRLRGNHQIQVTLRQPHTGDDSVTLPVATFVGAERQNGWVAVEAREEQRLLVQSVSANGGPLLDVDPIDLPGMGGDVSDRSRIVAAVRYVQPGYAVSVQEQTFDQRAVPTALADRMDTVSVLSETGLLQHQLDVSFRAVGMQSLRFVLPENADVWSVQIDGEPVEVREAQGAYHVPLPGIDDPAASRSLRLTYRSYVNEPGTIDRLQQSPPLIAAVSGSGETQPLEVLQQEWTLHYPHNMVLLESDGLFEPTSELSSDRWLSDMQHAITLPTLAEAGWRIGIVAVIVLALGIIGLMWRRLGGVIATAIIVVGGFFVLFLLLLPTTQHAREAAKRTMAKAELADGEGAEMYEYYMTGDAMEGMPAAEPTPPLAAGDASSLDLDDPQAQQPNVPATADFEQRSQSEGQSEFAGEPTVGQPQRGAIGPASASPPAQGALLSLSLDLDAPAGSRQQTFRTLAPAHTKNAPALNISYANRSFREALMLIIAAGLTLVMWWLGHSSMATKLGFALLTIVVPIAIAPITPPLLMVIVEGVLLGGIIGCLLWSVLAVVTLAGRCCPNWCPASWRTKSSLNTIAGLLIALGSLTFIRPADAQESLPPATPAAKPHVIQPNGPALPTVILPYEGDDPLAAERVFLPQVLFRELWLKVHPEQRPQPQSPVDGLVAEALYAVDVAAASIPQAGDIPEDQTISINGRLTLFSFRKQPVWVTLPFDEVAITSVTLDEQTAVLQSRDNGKLAVLLSTPGLHVLDLQFDVPAELRPNSGELTLPLQAVTAGSLTVTIPQSDAERTIRVLADGTTVSSQTSTNDDGQTQVEVGIDGGGPLRVSWQPKATRGGRDTIVHAESKTTVEIADAGVQMTAEFVLQVRQGVLAEVPFQFPETVRLKRITGPDVGGWQIGGEGDERTLTVFLRRNVEDSTTITAELFVPQDDRSDEFDIEVPSFAPENVTRETGQLAVIAGAHLEVRATSLDGLRQINREDVTRPTGGDAGDANIQLAYRFAARPWALNLAISPDPPEATALAEHGIYVGHRKVMYSTHIRYDLSGAPQQTLTISLTEDFLTTSVIGEGIEDWFVEDAELTIDFGQPRVGQVDVALEGYISREADDDVATLITPLPLDLDRQQSLLAVWVDPMYSARLDTFPTWRIIDRGELSNDLRQLHSQSAQFAFRSSAAEPDIINFDLIRQQPQITADAMTLIAVSDVSVDYGLTLRWTIERAATDSFAFTLPAWLQDRLELTGPNIRQTEQTLTDDGQVRWNVQLTDAVRGQYLLTAVATLPPPDDGRVPAPNVDFEQPPLTPAGEFTEVEAQQSFAILVNLSRGHLLPLGDVGPLTVRREQLPLTLRDELLARAMAIVRLPQETELAWTLQRVAEKQTHAAQITAADLTSVVADDGSIRTLASYRIRNRGQQFLALQLPESSRVLSVVVKDQPARCLTTQLGEQPVTLVPLPQTSAVDLSFVVRVVLQDQLPGITRLDASAFGRNVSLPVPQVITPAQSSEYGLPVVHTSWTVHLPEDLDASPIKEATQTNVSLQTSSAAQAMAELQLYRDELADLNRLIVSKDVSSAQRRQLARNIDVLGRQLQSHKSSSPPSKTILSELSAADRNFASQNEELLAESLANAKQTEQEMARGGTASKDESAATTNGFGRHFIIGCNSSIAADNSSNGTIMSSDKLLGFRLDPSAVEKKNNAAKGAPTAGKPSDSRSKLRGRLESQVPQLAVPNVPEEAHGDMGGAASAEHRWSDQARRQSPTPGQTIGNLAQLDGMSLFDGYLPGVPDDPFGVNASIALGAPAAWAETGGLSLPIELPTTGQTLTFTKSGGQPRLALSVRPRETGTTAIRWLWAIVVFAAGAWLLHHLAHKTRLEDCSTAISLSLIGVGLIALLCLPLPFSVVGAFLLITGCTLAMLSTRRRNADGKRWA